MLLCGVTIEGYLERYRDRKYVEMLGPGQNDSIFHSIFPLTFDLKVEPWLSVVEHVWPNDSISRSTFLSTFLSTFELLIFPQRVSAKIFTITYICRPVRRYCTCFHSTSSTRWPNSSIFTQQQFFCSILLTKIKLRSTSLDVTRLTQQVGQTARFLLDFLSSKNSSEKSSRLARA